MNDKQYNKVLKRAKEIAEKTLCDNAEHSAMCDAAIRYGLGKALEEAIGLPVDHSKDTDEPGMHKLIDRIWMHFVCKSQPIPVQGMSSKRK